MRKIFFLVCGLPILTTPDGNGGIATSATTFPVGSTLDYECDFGYSPSGLTTTQCQMADPDVFFWSLDTSLPTCVPGLDSFSLYALKLKNNHSYTHSRFISVATIMARRFLHFA